MKTWKKTLALLLAVMMAFSLVACGNTNDNPGSNTTATPDAASTPGGDTQTGEPTTIYFCNYAVLETAHTDYWNKLIADFEDAHPEYHVEVVSAAFNDVMTYATTRVGGGERMDCM